MIFTDHKPLCYLLSSDHFNGRLKRFSTKLQPWMVQFQYLPGPENTFADALSRQDWRRTGEEERAVEKTSITVERDEQKSEEETGVQRYPSLARGDVGDQPQQKKRKDIIN